MGTHAALRSRGFTLVELLIAMAILGMVVGLASYGYSLYTRHWEGRVGHFDRAQAQYQRLDLAIAALENTLPYVVRDARGRPGFYFLGREEGLTLVTLSPVFTPGDLAVIRLFREPAGDGRWRLVYEEAPLGDTRLRRAEQTLPFRHRMVVLDGLPALSFAFYGWRSVQARLEAADSPELGLGPEWSAEYDGLALEQHPQRIALRIADVDTVVFVPERADSAYRRYVSRE